MDSSFLKIIQRGRFLLESVNEREGEKKDDSI